MKAKSLQDLKQIRAQLAETEARAAQAAAERAAAAKKSRADQDLFTRAVGATQPFFPPIMLVTLYAGWRWGLVPMVAGAGFATWLWSDQGAVPMSSDELTTMVIYLLCAVMVLIVAEMYCMLILSISLIINADPLVRPPLEREDDDKLPVVDVSDVVDP